VSINVYKYGLWPARLHRLAKSISRNRCLGSINVYKYGFRLHRLAEFIHWNRFLGSIQESPNFNLLRSPRIDSKEPIPPGCVAWRAGTITLFYSYSVPSPHRFFKNSSSGNKQGCTLDRARYWRARGPGSTQPLRLKNIEPVFVNVHGAQESISPAYVAWRARARICKCLWSPGIDSEKSISPPYVAWRARARICRRLWTLCSRAGQYDK
jgi:hypothetical protein